MVHILNFLVNGIRGALPLDENMYLVRMVALDPPPEDTPGVIGTLNLHGIRVPVYSLHKLFGLPDHSPCLTDTLIIGKIGSYRIALWVDDIFVVQEYTDEEILPVLPISTIPGVTISNDIVMIHDLSVFLESYRAGETQAISSLPDLSGKNIGHTPVFDSSEQYESERIHQQLLDRAAELAKPEGEPPETSSIEVLKFRLVYRDYATEMRFVREVVLTREITPVPTAPDHIVGVCPVRGEIIPLVDLRVLLSIPEKGLTDLNQVIVLTDGYITFGILADQITGISVIPMDKIQRAGPEFSPGEPNFILGVDESGVMVIHAAAILADPKMIVDQSGDSEQSIPYGQGEGLKNSVNSSDFKPTHG